jgi:methylenetetrahydrofolate dehydrogenase (NADP+)/methenyltetrahydrofolate cyclohydrolase
MQSDRVLNFGPFFEAPARMTARIIDGKAHAAALRAELKAAAAGLVKRGVTPGLAVVMAGDNPASRIYVRNKVQACEEAGVHSEMHAFPLDAPEAELISRVQQLNADANIDGILVQLPLPPHVDEARVLAAVVPAKDVDGFHVQSAGALLIGAPAFVACTPAGIMYLLEKENIPLTGRHAVVLGRSNIVGKPVALLLLQKDATVTICHSKTPDLAAHTRTADILVAAVGRLNLVGADMVKPGACVIDVGTNRTADGKLRGDVDFDSVSKVAGSITPVPGGVGPMTVAMLVANTLRAAARRT